MDIIDTFNISGSGLTAQRVRLQSVASNMANARTTRSADGSHYQRRVPVLESMPIDPFGDMMDQELATAEVAEVRVYDTPGIRRFDPTHPDADGQGYVTMPDINILHEMVDMMTASRTYEANANVVDVTKDMAMKALEIGR